MFILYGILALGIYVIIGAGVWGVLSSNCMTLVDYDNYIFLTVVLWPLMMVIELIIELVCFFYDIYKEIKNN